MNITKKQEERILKKLNSKKQDRLEQSLVIHLVKLFGIILLLFYLSAYYKNNFGWIVLTFLSGSFIYSAYLAILSRTGKYIKKSDSIKEVIYNSILNSFILFFLIVFLCVLVYYEFDGIGIHLLVLFISCIYCKIEFNKLYIQEFLRR